MTGNSSAMLNCYASSPLKFAFGEGLDASRPSFSYGRAVNAQSWLNCYNDRTFIMAGLLTFADKIISSQLAEEIRREIRMLKVEKIIFEEGMKEGMEEGILEGEHRYKIKIAENMIRAGKTIQEIAEITEMAIEDILKLPKMASIK